MSPPYTRLGHDSGDNRDEERHEDDLPDFIFQDEDPETWEEQGDISGMEAGDAVRIKDENFWEDEADDSGEDRYFPDNSPDPWEVNHASEAGYKNDADDYDKVLDRASLPTDSCRDDSQGAGLRTSLIVVAAVVALTTLLTLGGYRVMQQHSATQSKIEDMQSRLAGIADPEEVAAALRAVDGVREDNAEIRALITSLQEDNQRLTATLVDVEQRLEEQRESNEKAHETPGKDTAVISPASKPAVPANMSNGEWFVNFGAYREQRLANKWAQRLRGDSGDKSSVAVMRVNADGRALYRVRITGLASEAAARSQAARLEQRFDLGPLWVGKE